MKFYESKGWGAELPFVGLLLLTVGWFYLSLLSGSVLKTLHPDALYLYMPVFANISRIFAAGEYPYWLPTHLAGIPLDNATHFTPLYPFYFFQWGLYQTPLACATEINLVIGFHLLLYALNTYLMMRLLSLNRFPAVAGALIAACLPTTGVLASWVNIIAPLSWVPLAIAGTHLILEDERRRAGIVLATIGLAMICLASPAQEFIYTLYLCAGMCLFKIILLIRRQEYPTLRRTLTALFLTGLMVFALTAPVVIAILTQQNSMIRFAGTHPAVIGSERFPVEALLEGQLTLPVLLARLFWPVAHLPITGDPYLGIVPGVLIFCGFRGIRTRPFLWPFLFFAGYGLLSATGEHLGVVWINHALPLLNKIREADRFLVFTAITAPVLAAFGLQFIIAEAPGKTPAQLIRENVGGLTAFLFVLILSVAAALYTHSDSSSFVRAGLSLLLALFLVWGVFLCRGSMRLKTAVALLFLVALIFPTLGTPLWAAFPLRQPSAMGVKLFNDPEIQDAIGVLSEAKGITDPEYRFVYHTNRLSPVDWAMLGAYSGLRSFESFFQPLPLEQYKDFANKEAQPGYLQMLGGRYWVWEKGLPPPPAGFSLLKSYANVDVYSADHALPHCFAVDRLTGYYLDREDFFRQLAVDARINPCCYLEKDSFEMAGRWLAGGGKADPATRVTLLKGGSNAYTYRVSGNRPTLLVLNEYFGPHWQAKVDGISQPLFKVNMNQLGLLVEAGTHRVEYTYRPRLYYALLFGSGFLWLAGLLYLCSIPIRKIWKRLSDEH